VAPHTAVDAQAHPCKPVSSQFCLSIFDAPAYPLLCYTPRRRVVFTRGSNLHPRPSVRTDHDFSIAARDPCRSVAVGRAIAGSKEGGGPGGCKGESPDRLDIKAGCALDAV